MNVLCAMKKMFNVDTSNGVQGATSGIKKQVV